MEVIEQGCFVKSDHNQNNNKYWDYKVFANGTFWAEWGRIGRKQGDKTKDLGSVQLAQAHARKKVHEKLRSRNGEIPYRQLDVVTNQAGVVSASVLNQIAHEQIETNNPLAQKLVDYFTKVNAHNIATITGGQITFNFDSGSFQTPLGLVSQSNIDQANMILSQIGDLIVDHDYGHELGDLTNDYLMLVPQDIGRRKLNLHNFWYNIQALQKQQGIVDALQASLASYQTQKSDDTDTDLPEVFSVRLELEEDQEEIDRIRAKYVDTRSDSHNCSHLDVHRVYRVSISTVNSAYEQDGAKMDHRWELWHGTRASNCLSILKAGLVIPPSQSAHCTARCFGNGVYASDISTKALNYAYGYWDGKGSDNNCFAFLVQMAMGNYYEIQGYGYSNNGVTTGFDSTFVKAGNGLYNNEMIVYRTSQVRLTHLVEFK